MLPGQCFCGDFGALGFRKTAFHGPAGAFFQNTLLQSRQPKKPAGEISRKKPEEVPEEAGRRSQPEAARHFAGMRYNPYL